MAREDQQQRPVATDKPGPHQPNRLPEGNGDGLATSSGKHPAISPVMRSNGTPKASDELVDSRQHGGDPVRKS